MAPEEYVSCLSVAGPMDFTLSMVFLQDRLLPSPAALSSVTGPFLKYLCIYAAWTCHSTPLKTGAIHLVLCGSSGTVPWTPRGPQGEGPLVIEPDHSEHLANVFREGSRRCCLVFVLIYLKNVMLFERKLLPVIII